MHNVAVRLKNTSWMLLLVALVFGLVVGGSVAATAGKSVRKTAVTATTLTPLPVSWTLSSDSYTEANCEEDTWSWGPGLQTGPCKHYVATLTLASLPPTAAPLPRLVSKAISIHVPSASSLNIPDEIDGKDVRCSLFFPGSWVLDGETFSGDYAMHGSNYVWTPKDFGNTGFLLFDGTTWNETDISFKSVYMIPPVQTAEVSQKFIFQCAEYTFDAGDGRWVQGAAIRLDEPASSPITITDISVTSSTFGG